MQSIVAALFLATTASAANACKVNAAFASVNSFASRKCRCRKTLNSLKNDEFVSHDSSGAALITDRRKLLTASCAASAAMILSPKSATAAKGAAEYDFEFYVRDLV
jgi:hypothetical protein